MKYTKVMIVTLFCIGFVLGSRFPDLRAGWCAAVCWPQLREDSPSEVVPRQPEWSKLQAWAARPHGMAFDGANMWVVEPADSTVTKLRAADGANLGKFSVGRIPGRGL